MISNHGRTQAQISFISISIRKHSSKAETFSQMALCGYRSLDNGVWANQSTALLQRLGTGEVIPHEVANQHACALLIQRDKWAISLD